MAQSHAHSTLSDRKTQTHTHTQHHGPRTFEDIVDDANTAALHLLAAAAPSDCTLLTPYELTPYARTLGTISTPGRALLPPIVSTSVLSGMGGSETRPNFRTIRTPFVWELSELSLSSVCPWPCPWPKSKGEDRGDETEAFMGEAVVAGDG
jgi:hypothetical protein